MKRYLVDFEAQDSGVEDEAEFDTLRDAQSAVNKRPILGGSRSDAECAGRHTVIDRQTGRVCYQVRA